MTDDADEVLPTRASRRWREREGPDEAPPEAPTQALQSAGDGPPTQAFVRDVGLDAYGDLPDTKPTPIDASIDGAPAADPQPPTEAMAWETAVVPQVAPGGPVPRHPMFSGDVTGQGPSGPSALDALFEPGQFRDFEPSPIVPRELQAGATAVLRAARNRPSLTPAQRWLLWAAGVLVAILVLIALFAIGRRLPAMFAAPVPVQVTTPSPTPTEEPVDTTAGPVQPGEHAWDQLRGGECLDPYVSAWEEHYTVVDCGSPHAGQLLIRAQFPGETAPDGAFPGFDALTAQMNLLCTSPEAIDYAAAREYEDIVVEGAHAVTAEEWEDGHTEYFCFLTRSGGEPLDRTLVAAGDG